MSPKVLFIAKFHPDSLARWLADGFAYAGCRVERAGPRDFPAGWPAEEFPRVRDLGAGHDPSAYAMAEALATGGDPFALPRLDLFAVLQHFAGLHFSPDLVVVCAADWPGLGNVGELLDLTTREGSMRGARLAVIRRSAQPGAWPKHVTLCHASFDLAPAVDPYAFAPAPTPRDTSHVAILSPALAHHADALTAASETGTEAATPMRFVAYPSAVSVGMQRAALSSCDVAIGSEDAADSEFCLRAQACGARVVRLPSAVALDGDGDALPIAVRAALSAKIAAFETEPDLALAKILRGETWRHRAIEILTRAGLEPGPVPRL